MLRSIALASIASFIVAGCTLQGTTEPVGYAEVTSAGPPDNIETYPSTYYEGRPVFFYRDRWYYREGPRWNYYRQEPRPLYEHRTRVIVASPPKRGIDHEERHEHDDRERHERR